MTTTRLDIGKIMNQFLLIAILSAGLPVLAQDGATASAEFVTQVLEPTGGKIQRPKNWFYAEGHRGPSYTWILSREDSSKGPYTTGVRIQAFMGVKEGTGKSPMEFVLDFFESKKKEAAKVIKTCPQREEGLFTRVCLETEEGPYHILYSLFWGTSSDLVVISISGTTKELWDTYSATFDKMRAFELIDMKRFDEAKAGNAKATGAPATTTSQAPANVEVERLVLYQPDDVLTARLSGAEELASYTQQVVGLVGTASKNTKISEALDVVIVIKPGGKARVWFVSDRAEPGDRVKLAGEIESLSPPKVTGGPVAVAVCINIAGAKHKNPQDLPMPEEWRKAANGKRVVPDGLMDVIWKD